MEWISGLPIVDGQYLCAIVGYDQPRIITFYKEANGGYSDTNGLFYGSDEILYYMNLGDISMPEGW